MALQLCGKRLLLTKNAIFSNLRKQHGYIVLVPEIGEDLPEKNPLLHHDGLPEFNNITIENCRAAIAKQTLEFEANIKAIDSTIRCKQEKKENIDVFSDVIDKIEVNGAQLDLTWGLSKTLYLGKSTLMPTTSYITIHERAKRARATKFNNPTIYETIKSEIGKPKETFNSEQQRLLKKFVVEGKLNGLDLSHEKKELLIDNRNKLNQEQNKLKQKVEIATQKFIHTVKDNMIIRDFPEHYLKLLVQDSKYPQQGPWNLRLTPSVYKPSMEYCSDREVRWNLWQAHVRRCSGHNERELATSLHLEEIRFLRRDQANILGYDTFADMSMETKMAGSVSNVKEFFDSLRLKAFEAQQSELNSLLEFASERGFNHQRIELWDLMYWRRKQLNTLYDLNESHIKDYFPLPTVLEGLFQLSEKLFNINIKQRNNVATWHKDVKYYDVFEPHSSAPVAGFYFDPYARSEAKLGAQSNGWMVAIQNKSRIADKNPLAALIFNFDAPSKDRPSCLSFGEVKNLFFKFGHAMQHLLTRVDYSDLAGLSNVEWDAVEVSGHVLTHWLTNKSVIDSISKHCDSEDKMPAQLFDRLIKSDQHMAGVDLSRELYLSALDLELHTSKDFWVDITNRLWPQYRCFPLDKYDSHPCSWTQIVDEWGGAYYSHLWAKMLAADVFSAFYEVQNDQAKIAEVGKRYRNTFLASGGSLHASEVFRKFRGRDPSPNALLSSLGLKNKKP